jgi:hypothetical protein
MVSITENQLMSIREVGDTLAERAHPGTPAEPGTIGGGSGRRDQPSALGRHGEYSVESL